MIIEVLIIFLIILAFPVGLLIAWMARDELIQGRKWFKLLITICFVLSIVFYILNRREIVFTLAFIAIVALVSLWKSFDKKWAKREWDRYHL